MCEAGLAAPIQYSTVLYHTGSAGSMGDRNVCLLLLLPFFKKRLYIGDSLYAVLYRLTSHSGYT